jgi:hypothetical protein
MVQQGVIGLVFDFVKKKLEIFKGLLPRGELSHPGASPALCFYISKRHEGARLALTTTSKTAAGVVPFYGQELSMLDVAREEGGGRKDGKYEEHLLPWHAESKKS